jgi:small-conductance mechanosensitive channel
LTDVIAVAETALADPLITAFAVMVLGALLIRLLFKHHPMRRAMARVALLALLTVLLLRGGVVPYQPQRSAGPPLHDAVAALLKIAWWLWAGWFLAGLLHHVVVWKRRPREGKLVRDLVSGIVYLAAAFAIIAYVFGLPIQGLLATYGAIAIILGLALQSTLNDVFSGIVLSFSHPYRPGDWIKLEGGTEGQVIEMNWRATHILTAHRDLAVIPNSVIAKSRIVNVSYPSSIHGVTVRVQLESALPPASGTELLELALLNVRSILANPKASVSVASAGASHTEFELTFFVEQLGSAAAAQNELFDLIFRHATSAGARLASPQDISAPAPNDPLNAKKSAAERLLDLVTIFAALTPSERAAIAGKLKLAAYEEGEVLVKPGMVLQSLFIVGAGVISVTRGHGVGAELLRLGPADHFGEIGLLTGASSGATITALTPSIVYELTKQDLAPILQDRRQFAQELGRALAQRQALGRAVVTGEPHTTLPTANLSTWFSERIHQLFELTSVR